MQINENIPQTVWNNLSGNSIQMWFISAQQQQHRPQIFIDSFYGYWLIYKIILWLCGEKETILAWIDVLIKASLQQGLPI